ncbi:MAG TPA: hypothetical protein VLZ74_09790 [Methylocella sp.]|nr:hypothetical protein [Methylocella sp.]
MSTDNYFGVCPVCGKTDGYINTGRVHWFFCKEHKLRWWAGINLFSSWQHETEEEQRRQYDELGFGAFTAIKPADGAGEEVVRDEDYYAWAEKNEGAAAPSSDEEVPF